MPIILALLSLAYADRIYWSSPPAGPDSAAAQRTLPGVKSMPLDELVVGGAAASDPGPAIDTLRRELEAVRPLVKEFDGELQIISRLAKATADVTGLRTAEDTELLWRALCFQGFAVHRYFGERLGTDPAAAPYRVGEGSSAVVAAWLDAAALFGPREPIAEDVPESNQRIAFDAVRAMVQVMPAATLAVGKLAEGASLTLDGRTVDTTAQTRTIMIPGRHFLEVRVGEMVLLRGNATLGAGATMSAEAPFGPKEMEALASLAAGPDGWAVPATAMTPISGANEPVYIGIPKGGKPTLLRVDEGTAKSVLLVAEKVASSGFVGHAAVGGGWLSTGDFFLQNVDGEPPREESTVNAATVAVAGDAEWYTGAFAVSAGVSVELSAGGYHQLPVGDSVTRTFTYAHLGIGTPWIQATVGPLFPWYLGVGLKGRIAVAGDFELTANGAYGVPMSIAREGEEPAFEPLPVYTAWGGAGWRFD